MITAEEYKILREKAILSLTEEEISILGMIENGEYTKSDDKEDD